MVDFSFLICNDQSALAVVAQANCQYDGSMGSEGMTESDKKNLEIGAVVVVCEMPAFVKTSNAMTALRDAKSVISIGEPGRCGVSLLIL